MRKNEERKQRGTSGITIWSETMSVNEEKKQRSTLGISIWQACQ